MTAPDVSAPDLRLAQEIVVSGEAARFMFFLEPVEGRRRATAPGERVRRSWADAATDSRLHDRLVQLIETSVRKSIAGQYRAEAVHVAGDLSEIKAVITGSERLGSRSPLVMAFAGGRTFGERMQRGLESCRQEVLKTLDREIDERLRVRAEWEPGADVQVTGLVLGAGQSETDIHVRLAELRGRLNAIRRVLAAVALVFVVLIILTLFLGFSGDDWSFSGIIFAYLGVPTSFAALVALNGLRAFQEERRELIDALELRDTEDERERRALKLLQAHTFGVRRYYEQALRQRRGVFVLGVGCILAGFASVAAAFYVLDRNATASSDTTKIVIGVLGAAGTILANYVAAVFLRMFTSTINSTTSFHHRLVGTQHVHLAYLAAAKIDKDVVRDETLSQMAVALVRIVEGPETDSAVASNDRG